MQILIIARLTDKKLFSKLRPLCELEIIEKIHLIRRDPLHLKKIRNYNPPKYLRKYSILSEMYRILLAFYVIISEDITAAMGIYFLPHGIIAGIIAKLLRKPLIQNITGNDILILLQNRFMFRFISMADIIITRGEVTKDLLVKRGIPKDSIYSIPNVFDFKHILLPEDHNDKGHDYDMIYVGNFTQVKQIDILLNALHKVRYDYQASTLYVALVGDGPLRTEMENLAQELQIISNTSFLGAQKEVHSFLKRSKIFIMTSDYEGLPMAMIEAMACGLPCIMPDVSNIPTVAIHEHNALLVPVGDVEGFAQQIHRLLTDHELYARLAANALKIREDKRYEYSLEHTMKIWSEILEKLTQTTTN